MLMEDLTYDLWVGGVLELEDTTLQKALDVQMEYYDDGYEDAVIVDSTGKIVKDGMLCLTNFIYDLQKLTPLEAISEIAHSGLTNNEIARCVKVISSNPTFNFQKQ